MPGNRKSKPPIEIVFDPDTETLNAIYTDDLADLIGQETAVVFRASHVEPGEVTIEEHTYSVWYADLAPVGGPKLGPFTLRADALQAEVDWLRANILGLTDVGDA